MARKSVSKAGNNVVRAIPMILGITVVGIGVFFLLGPLCRAISKLSASAADFMSTLAAQAAETWTIFLGWLVVLAVVGFIAYLIVNLVRKAFSALFGKKGYDDEDDE